MRSVAGIGLRSPHLADLVRGRPATGFLEIHAENYLLPSPSLACIEDLRRDYPLSIHAVGLSVGSAEGLDDVHLGRVGALVKRLQPAFVSDHLSWSVSGGRFLNDLLPLPYTDETLAIVARNVDEMQQTLGRQVSIENPSCYLAFSHSTLSEPEFLAELVRRTGCGILLDANNIHVTAHNLRLDPVSWLDVLPGSAITQYHVAGHAVNDADGEPILIDDHGSRVSGEVWTLFKEIVARFGERPTLVEWDTDIPSLPVLLGEAARAEALLYSGPDRGAQAA